LSRNTTILLLALFASFHAYADSGDAVLQKISAQEARLPAVAVLIAEAKAAGVPVAYPTADFLIAKRFCQYGRDDVANDRLPRAREVAEEVAALLDRAEREARAGVEVPRVLPGTVRIDNGAFWANCSIGGKEEFRPVFFTGYGHSDPVVEDIPLLGEIGINVIQIEQGPEGVVNADGTVNTARITDRLLPALDRARDNGVMVNLLIGPHYFPAWAYEKWPALKVEPGAPGTQPFLKNSIEATEAREIYTRYLRTLIPLVKDHPALHSICLSNEPQYDKHQADPARVPLWHQYIASTHGDIGTLNALYGTHYDAFDQVPETPLSFKEKPAALYDVVRFNQGRFAGWHQWMVDIIHEMAPNLECHAKVMPLVWDRDSVFWGTDPLEFSQLGHINGNDCYFVPNDAGSPWASDWLVQGMYYDLQRSMAQNPIFNSENHLILDRTDFHVDASHIYTGIWQGAIHGQGSSATWIWGRTYDKKSDLEGLILHRAACTAAMSRSALDLMRLSREVFALQNQVPEVAILWSNAAQVHDPWVTTSRKNVYEALNFLGVPIGFVHEHQLATHEGSGLKCLIVAGAEAVTAEGLKGIRDFVQRGGVVLAYGDGNLSKEEYGRSTEPPAFAREIPRSERGEELAELLKTEMHRAGIEAGIAIVDKHGRLPYGVEWRSVVLDGHTLVNLVNFSRKPISVKLPDGAWQDLITLQSLPTEITLQPDTPVLAKG
jgi:hypothetical protein